AMPLETNSFFINLYLVFFATSFLSVAFLSASPLLAWQSFISSALLVGGQTVLLLGHVAALYSIKYQRETRQVSISARDLCDHWMLINRSWCTTTPVRRPLWKRKKGKSIAVLSQHYSFRGNFINTWHAVFVLLALALGFIAFYIGGRSSNIKTVVIYICL